MSDQTADETPSGDREIIAGAAVTSSRAALLRDLAAVLGRTPEALAAEWAAGTLPVPTTPVGDQVPPARWGLFDGPADLSARTGEYLREDFAR
ncbi:hypothetical protein [Streptomyces sp. BBFR2]|uniref:hypothetical protein n=1 Tax=Streptomyces sp. BBFR2 TaxID=3372854 RepID=UPI0037DA1C92